MKRLSRSQILLFHQELIDCFGGVQGICDEGLLDLALNAPFQTFAGDDLYPSVLEKGAKLAYGMICNHSFLDIASGTLSCDELYQWLAIHIIN